MEEISRVVLGTAALGMSYGLRASKGPVVRDYAEVEKILLFAYKSGITEYDTAPSYGEAEAVLGKYLTGIDKNIWTKLSDPSAKQDFEAADQSIDSSLRILKIDSIRYLQWHNWTEDLMGLPSFMKLWSYLKNDVRISALGASTYGVRDAMSAIKSGLFDLVQIEWNLLNQSVLLEVEEEAIKRGVKIALRSIFLQGVLTQAGDVLPVKLNELNAPRAKAEKVANQLGLPLNGLAFLAALGQRSKPFVLVGVDECKQLEDLVTFSKNQALPEEARVLVSELNVSDSPLIDPRNW